MTIGQALDKAGILMDELRDLDVLDFGDQLRADGATAEAIDAILATRCVAWTIARRQGLELVRAVWLTGGVRVN